MSESARIDALRSYELLDTPPEAVFDRLTALAADILDAPIALVSLIDEHRQWFKSRHGSDLAETPRTEAFCDHTIREPSGSVMVVEDARLDARFASNPYVVPEGGIRFYAGAKLTTPDGLHIGSLCVADPSPRTRPSVRDLKRLETLAGLVVDEFELRRSMRRENEKRRLLELAETMSNVGSWRFEPSSGRIVWSDEVYRIHGVDRAQFDPQLDEAVHFYHPKDRAAVELNLQRAIQTGEGFTFQLRLIRRDGAMRHVVCKATTERAATGEVSVVHGVFQDVTDHIENETRYRLLADNSRDILIRFGKDGLISYISPACRRIDVDPEAAVGQHVLKLIAPEHMAYSEALIAQLFSGAPIDRSKRREHRIVTASGRELWFEGNPTIIRDAHGEIAEAISVLRDITETRAAEQAQAASEARYRNLANTAPDLIAESRVDGTLVYVSPAAFAITGYTPEELIGRSSFSWMHPDDMPTMFDMCRAVFESKGAVQPRPVEYRALHKNGHEIWLESKPTPAIDPNTGRILGFTDVIRDITGHKKLAADLAMARVEAETAAAVKSEFLANMSHELRTPLTAVLGFSNLVAERTDLPAEAADHARRVVIAGKALLSTVNDILDFSKLEAGQVEIRPRLVAPSTLLSETVDVFEEMGRSKGLGISLSAVDLPTQVSLDPDRVRQILLNLIGNAIKFTDAGSVEVRAAYGRDGELRFEVADTGPGIPAEKLSKLFQRFSQVDGGATRKHGGTGLGLAICKGLVEAMQGEIGVDSRDGQGSTFWFSVPAPLQDASTPAPLTQMLAGAAHRLRGIRLLVADDNSINRRLVSAFLGPIGLDLVEAEDGVAAVSAAADQPFDAVLMDLRMPGLSGVEAALTIRAGGGPNADVPILAFSADVSPELPPGLFDGVITKPITIQAVIDALGLALGTYEGEPLYAVA